MGEENKRGLRVNFDRQVRALSSGVQSFELSSTYRTPKTAWKMSMVFVCALDMMLVEFFEGVSEE